MSEVQEKLQQEQEGSIQQKEEKVLEKAGVKFEDNTYKIDLRENAVQEQSTDEGVLRAEEPKVELQKVVEGDQKPEVPAEQETQTLELIQDDVQEEQGVRMQENIEKQTDVGQRIEKPQEEVILPENIQKVVEFMKETGGSLEDYVRLNADYSKIDENALLREFYKQTKPHLDNEEIDFLIEDKFSYDDDLDDNKDIKRKKLAYKEEITEARKFLNNLKDKYYDEVKMNSKLGPEQKQAIEFYNSYTKQQDELTAAQQKQSEQFTKLTEQVFSEDFKGFDFKVGDSKYRFRVNDVQQTKQVQSNIVESFKTFLDENNVLKDAQGYHKALFAARNADTLASHFYEQGKADAIRQLEAESKNINMDPRRTSNGVIETSGVKVRAVSGEDSSKLRIKIRK